MARLDQELVVRGLARSRSHAAQLIAAGRVMKGGIMVTRPATAVRPEDRLEVEERGEEYVSRAGTKLAGALRVFPDVAPEGKRCLDAGASTGGFTDVLLRRGAREVVAVDVGHGQLVRPLREDPRVRVFEGLNVRELDAGRIGGRAQLTVADLSFISLRLVMQALARATETDGDLLLMVKPQFEVGRGGLNRLGVVTSVDARRRAVAGVLTSAVGSGLHIRGVAQSELPGQDGNVEYFVWMKVPRTGLMPRIEGESGHRVEQAPGFSGLFPPRPDRPDGA
ncbi:TlyA family RNA methyltransferase [Arthrobacter echini]|uniref:TlyA family RNA methyltransferase n=1 Tax=Arthrobacter echini TaxID=1529066 RepID=A0A4S5E0M4_9MICC|nr:TlyA family RNA methyltransferase [Arthrobacter echini]THJ64868.1 TlyA family RNA methyltransferase [Arthrobacter echini]